MSRKQQSAVDVLMMIKHQVEEWQAMGLKVSILLAAIKAAFDNVNHKKLLMRMRELNLPHSLIEWTASFLTGRRIKLRLDGQLSEEFELSVGLPQGSPISPILFLIYARALVAEPSDTNFLQMSFIDDFTLLVASKSLARNCRALEKIHGSLEVKATESGIEFEPVKFELLHFARTKGWAEATVNLGGTIVHPKELIRCLGFFLDPYLNFKEHVRIRTTKAHKAWAALSRLTGVHRGLSARAIRQLHHSCVGPIMEYGAIVWKAEEEKLVKQVKGLEDVQKLAVRAVLGCNKQTPIASMEMEAGILPVAMRIDRAKSLYALRVLQMPSKHPIRVRSQPARDELNSESDIAMMGLVPASEKGTTLQKVVAKIRSHVKSWDIERLRGEWLAPWIDPPGARVVIEKGTKDEVAAGHRLLIADLELTDTNLVYTDGSKDGTLSSYAYCHKVGRRTVASDSGALGSSVEIVDCECIAVLNAVKYLQQFGAAPSYIFVDSQAAIRRLTGVTYYSQILRRYDTQNITIQWCPGHSGVEGNEEVDALAKAGLKKKPPKHPPTTLSFLRSSIRSDAKVLWQDTWMKDGCWDVEKLGKHYFRVIGGEPRFILKGNLPRVSKKWSSAYFHLKFGKGHYLPFLQKIGKIRDATCRACGETDETVEHVFLECQALKFKRKKILGELLADNYCLPALFHTKKGQSAVLEFIMKTGFGTNNFIVCTGREEVEDEATGLRADEYDDELEELSSMTRGTILMDENGDEE